MGKLLEARSDASQVILQQQKSVAKLLPTRSGESFMELLRKRGRKKGHGEMRQRHCPLCYNEPLLQNLPQNTIKTHKLAGTHRFLVETSEGAKLYTRGDVRL